MSWFRKKPITAARRLLFDPDFACTVPGVDRLSVDYDPGAWVRLPTVGQDRTTWVGQVLAAYGEDLGWTPGTPEHAKITAAANEIADTALSYTASFVTFPPGPTDFGLAHVHVLDEELMLLNYGDPEQFLELADIRPVPLKKTQTYPQGWRYNSDTFIDPDSGPGVLLRAHKRLDTTPAVHLMGIGLTRGRSHHSAHALSLCARSRVVQPDGTKL